MKARERGGRFDLENIDDLNFIKERVFFSLRKYKLAHLLDDAYSHVVLKFWENPYSKQSVEFCVIDWLRSEFGDRRATHGESKISANMNWIQYEELLGNGVAPEIIIQSLDRLIGLTRSKSRTRICIKLYYIWGLRLNEIADLLEVTESRVSQLVAIFQQKLNSSITKKRRKNMDILSKREAEIAANVILGKSNKKIADQLFVTQKTVKFHLTNIYKKMNVKSRAELIAGWWMHTLDKGVGQFIEIYMPSFHPPEKAKVPESEGAADADGSQLPQGVAA